MNIACLGWGSLIWNPDSLPLRPERPPRWFTDGPELPIEFARKSSKDRITLVLVRPEAAEPPAVLLPVLWAYLTCPDIEEAHEALARREWGTDPLPRRWTSQDWINWKNENIARWPTLPGSSYPHAQQMAAWANAKKLDGVVWTILPPRFKKIERVPMLPEVVDHLRGLSGSELQEARDYVRNAPPQIRTNYRAAIERELGWACDPSANQDEIC
jgi:hypothetical protein